MEFQYFIELDEETDEVIELVRFVRTENELWAEEYTKDQWIKNPSKFYYYRDPPPYFEEIDEQEARRVMQQYKGIL